MRISDWSSDVCSSDLGHGPRLALESIKRRPYLGVATPQFIDLLRVPILQSANDSAVLSDYAGGDPALLAFPQHVFCGLLICPLVRSIERRRFAGESHPRSEERRLVNECDRRWRLSRSSHNKKHK